jgi:hypothetical protein
MQDLVWHWWIGFEKLRPAGQGLAEYALLLVVIGIVAIGMITTLGGSVSSVFSQVNNGL